MKNLYKNLHRFFTKKMNQKGDHTSYLIFRKFEHFFWPTSFQKSKGGLSLRKAQPWLWLGCVVSLGFFFFLFFGSKIWRSRRWRAVKSLLDFWVAGESSLCKRWLYGGLERHEMQFFLVEPGYNEQKASQTSNLTSNNSNLYRNRGHYDIITYLINHDREHSL